MRAFVLSMMTATLVAAIAALPAPAAAEKKQTTKIGDLSKAGYNCKQIGPESHLCTRGKGDATYGCDQGDCQNLGGGKPLPTRVTPKGSANPKAPVSGGIRR